MKSLAFWLAAASSTLVSCASEPPLASEGPSLGATLVGQWDGGAMPGRQVLFSSDGKLLAAANASGEIVLRRVSDWKVEARLKHDGGATSLAFDPKTARLYSAGYDGTVRAWDPSTGLESGRFSASRSAVWSIDLSPDGKQLATSGEDTMVRLWPLEGEARGPRTLAGHERNVWEVRFRPGGAELASGSFDQTARIWRASGQPLKVLHGHRQAIVGLDYRPDGQVLATGGDDSTIRFWRADGRPLGTIAAGNHVYQLDFSPDGAWLASGGRARGGFETLWHGATGLGSNSTPVHLWRLSDGALVAALPHPADVAGIAFSPDGRYLATSDEEGGVRVWRIALRRKRSG